MVRQKAAGEPYSLLITDDEGEYLTALQTTFQPYGYETHLARSGTEAIEVARQYLVHAAIMDMEMPDLSGLETISIICREYGEPLPFVIISADTSKEMMIRALAAHAYSFVPKPFNRVLVREVVEQMLRKFYGAQSPEQGLGIIGSPQDRAPATPRPKSNVPPVEERSEER